jgi:hypothetical protein
MRGRLYQILDNPTVYRLSQKIFALRAEVGIDRCISEVLSRQGKDGLLLRATVMARTR